MTCSPLHPPVRTAARSRAPGSALSNAPADVARRMTTGSDVGQSTAVLRRDRTAELCTPLAWFRTECTSSSTGTCVPCRSYFCSWVRPCCCFWVGLVGKPERTGSTTRDSPSEWSSADETRCRPCHLLRAHGGDVGSLLSEMLVLCTTTPGLCRSPNPVVDGLRRLCPRSGVGARMLSGATDLVAGHRGAVMDGARGGLASGRGVSGPLERSPIRQGAKGHGTRQGHHSRSGDAGHPFR